MPPAGFALMRGRSIGCESVFSVGFSSFGGDCHGFRYCLGPLLCDRRIGSALALCLLTSAHRQTRVSFRVSRTLKELTCRGQLVSTPTCFGRQVHHASPCGDGVHGLKASVREDGDGSAEGGGAVAVVGPCWGGFSAELAKTPGCGEKLGRN